MALSYAPHSCFYIKKKINQKKIYHFVLFYSTLSDEKGVVEQIFIELLEKLLKMNN
jgi:hypothetical protein